MLRAEPCSTVLLDTERSRNQGIIKHEVGGGREQPLRLSQVSKQVFRNRSGTADAIIEKEEGALRSVDSRKGVRRAGGRGSPLSMRKKTGTLLREINSQKTMIPLDKK